MSSFGIGGTNAHAVLEQAPAPAPSGPSRDWQLILLSAKTAPALEQQTANLAAHLGAHLDLNFADVAHTLQIGRAEFEHRRAVTARSASEAAELLGSADPTAIVTRRAVPSAHPVVFMFTGQGAQYVDMGRGLYESERTYREVVDQCLALLRSELDLDLRPLLYPAGDAPPGAAERLQRTEIAQPALFVVEYALAQLWRSWGVEPEACIGHSIGEYVAAAVSGVLRWEDGLRLVALRGRLMGEVPVGVMTAVPESAERVGELLAGATDLWLSVVSAPSVCVVSGTAERVAEFDAQLQERDGITCRRLHTSHAFHSGLMDDAVKPFVEAVRAVPRRAPLDDWFYVPGWRRAEVPAALAEPDASGHALVFTDASAFANQVTVALTAGGWTTTMVEAAEGSRESGGSFAIEPGSLDDTRSLVAALVESNHLPTRVVHLWSAASDDVSEVELVGCGRSSAHMLG